jgi:hypothetical protein
MSLSHIPCSFQYCKFICKRLYDALCDVRDRMFPVPEVVPIDSFSRGNDEGGPGLQMRDDDLGLGEAVMAWREMQERQNHIDEFYRAEAMEQSSHRAGLRLRGFSGGNRVYPITGFADHLAVHHRRYHYQNGLSQ